MTHISTRRLPGTRPERLELEGREFVFVTRQRDKESAIYKSDDSYLRIGKPERIQNDLAVHKKMEAAGFPVAALLAEGQNDGEAYFIESSLGDQHFGALFADDIARAGNISTETFEQFVSIAEKFARAQLGTQGPSGDLEEFKKGILLGQLCIELPEYAEKLRARFDAVQEHAAKLPFVMTHGDFNPNNLYPAGVIDLEDSFRGPFGYDLVSAIAHIDSFPDSEEYEYFARYRFTPEQTKQYLERMDAVSETAGLPPLSEFLQDFAFCRAVWLAAEIPNTPKLQKFRFDMVIREFLS